MKKQSYKQTDAGLIQKANKYIYNKQYSKARDIFTRICNKNKNNPEAWLTLGTLHGQLGSYKEAVSCFQHVISITPHNAIAHYNLGLALQTEGKAEEAIKSFRKSLDLSPNSLEAQYYLGIALKDNGHLNEAEHILTRLLQKNQQAAELHGNLASVLYAKGEYSSALESCSRALQLKPDFADAYCQKARILVAQEKPEEALAAYTKCLQLNPGLLVAHKEISQVYFSLDNFIDAAINLENALAIDKQDIASWLRLGDIYLISSKRPDATRCYKKAIEIQPEHIMAHSGLARCYESLGMLDEAISRYTTIISLDSHNERAISGLAGIYMIKGQYDIARDLLRPTIKRGAQYAGTVKTYSEICLSNGEYQSAIDALTGFINKPDKEKANIHLAHYQFGTLLDKQGEYDEAFCHFKKANRLSIRCYDVNKQLRFIDDIQTAFSAHRMPQLPRTDIGSRLPVFIIGMPRSGTTLVEQIVDSHPLIHGAGERTDIWDIFGKLAANTTARQSLFPDHLHLIDKDNLARHANKYLATLIDISDGALRVTDKLPSNFLFVGLIELLYPNARIIHCKRNAVDTCLSIYFHDMDTSHAYACDLADMGNYYCKYLQIMEHWNNISSIPILNIRYEDIINDQEQASKKIIEFCGMEWDTQCLGFHKNTRAVGTHSHSQVRKPIYRDSVERWRNYEKHIGKLHTALGDCTKQTDPEV